MHHPRAQHSGFTLIELLVVIAIVSLLVAMLLPALKGAREAAVQVTCMSQMRQYGQATFSYQNENGEAFPWYVQDFPAGSHGFGSNLERGWFNLVLPYLDVSYRYDPFGGEMRSKTDGYGLYLRRCPTELASTGAHYGAFYAGSSSSINAPFVFGQDSSGNRLPPVLAGRIASPSTFMMYAEAQRNGFTITSVRVKSWNTDSDGDGLIDSFAGDLPWFAYAGAMPDVHLNGQNIVMCDGHVESVDFQTFIKEGAAVTGFWTENPTD